MDKDLIILSLASGARGPYPLDPIRIMKGAFLVSQLGSPELKKHFAFKPYNYGPFDLSVYETLDQLKKRNLLAEVKEGDSKYPTYSITAEGSTALTTVSSGANEKELSWLKDISAYVTSRSFEDLLTEIYKRFPTYAEKSVFKKKI